PAALRRRGALRPGRPEAAVFRCLRARTADRSHAAPPDDAAARPPAACRLPVRRAAAPARFIARAKARTALSRPARSAAWSGPDSGAADSVITRRTSSGPIDRRRARMRATVPLTWAAAIDVPFSSLYRPLSQAE